MRLVRVAVPVPALDALTYSVPEEFPDPPPGARVLVPLGKRTMTGVVIGAGIRGPGSGVRAIRDGGLRGGDDEVRAAEGARGSQSEECTQPEAPESPTDRGPHESAGSRIPDPGSRTPDTEGVRPIIDILDRDAFLSPDDRNELRDQVSQS